MGLEVYLVEAGLKVSQGIVCGDEMRLGLLGRVCKVGVPHGVAVFQVVQIGWKYIYVEMAINSMKGRLCWAWPQNLKRVEMVRIWGGWAEVPDINGRVRAGSGGHTVEELQAVDAPRVVQPPYAPEPNPVERFFRELRRAIEGRVYPDLQAKQEALEPILKSWQADPKQVRQLCGWNRIREALKAPPGDTQVIHS